MALRVSLANVSKGFELLDNDDYPAVFADYKVKEAGANAKNPGSKWFSLEFHLDGEAHPEAKNRKQWGSLGGTVNSLWAVKEFLLTMGYPEEELDADDDEDAVDPKELTEEELVTTISEWLDKVKMGRVILTLATETYDKRDKRTGEVTQGQRNVITDYKSVY